tara:strand:+ start:3 stop:1646 length:1644 start_codon:yes stop_codon:yes gene_type:complete
MKQIIRGFVFTFFVIVLNGAFLDFSYAQKAKKLSKSSKQIKSSQSTNKSKAAKYISRGKSRIKQKKYSDALSDFRKAHKLFPSKTTQNYIKRLLPIIKKQRASSSNNKNLNKSVVEKNSIPSPYQLSKEFFEISNELESSIRKMKIATMNLKPIDNKTLEQKRDERLKSLNMNIVKRPDDRRILRELAIEHEKNGDFLEAKNIYMGMIQNNPKEPDYHYFLGTLYSKMGKKNNAGFAFKEALYLDPNHKPTLEALSIYGTNSLSQLIVDDLINHSIENTSNNGSAQILNKTRDLYNSENYSDLIEFSQENEKEFSQSSSLVFYKGKSYEALGKNEEAKSQYKIAIEIDKSDIRSSIALGDIYFLESNYVYSAIVYNSVLENDPMNISLINKIGLSYYNGFEWAKAVTIWENLLKLSPNHTEVKKLLPEVYYILSLEYDRKGFSDLSRRSFSNALSVNSNSAVWLPNALKTAAKYYTENGFYQLAIKSYHNAMDIVPNDYDSYNGLGATYWYMGEKQMAISAWQNSLQLNSTQNAAKGWLLLANKSSN